MRPSPVISPCLLPLSLRESRSDVRPSLNITMTRGQRELRVYPELGLLLTHDLSDPASRFNPNPIVRAHGLKRTIALRAERWR